MDTRNINLIQQRRNARYFTKSAPISHQPHKQNSRENFHMKKKKFYLQNWTLIVVALTKMPQKEIVTQLKPAIRNPPEYIMTRNCNRKKEILEVYAITMLRPCKLVWACPMNHVWARTKSLLFTTFERRLIISWIASILWIIFSFTNLGVTTVSRMYSAINKNRNVLVLCLFLILPKLSSHWTSTDIAFEFTVK